MKCRGFLGVGEFHRPVPTTPIRSRMLRYVDVDPGGQCIDGGAESLEVRWHPLPIHACHPRPQGAAMFRVVIAREHNWKRITFDAEALGGGRRNGRMRDELAKRGRGRGK